MQKRIVFLCAFLFALSSCSGAENPKISGNTDDAKTDYFEGKTKLVYLNTVPYGSADSLIQDELNRLLDERGYDFAVDFVDIEELPDGSRSCVDVYEKMLSDGQQIDIVFTGVQNKKYPEGTYYHFIENSWLEPLNDYFVSVAGKNFYGSFDEKYWDRMTFTDGKIYGKSAAYAVSAPLSLHIDNTLFDTSDFDGTIECLIPKMEQIYRETGSPSLLLEPNLIPYENYLGLVKYKEIYVDAETGNAVNIFADERCIRYFKMISELRINGYAVTDEELIADGCQLAYIGMYNYLYADDDTFIIADSYYDRVNISSAVGISSQSAHKDEAFEFLALINTDPELSTLLYDGIKGRNYEHKGGHAVDIPNSGMPYSFAALTPANPIIALPRENEASDKKKNLGYQMQYVKRSPAYDLGYDIDVSEDIAKINSKYYGLFYGAFDDVDATLEEALEVLNGA